MFIGDELSAAGFRLAGIEVRTPAPGGERATFEAARQRAALVLITAELAARLPRALLSQALAAVAPLTLIVPDVCQRCMPPDLGRLVRTQLGIEA